MNRISIFLVVLGLILGSCCDKDFETPTNITNDIRAGAIDVTEFIKIGNSDCVGNLPSYSTVGATADGDPGSCWSNNGPLHNVWFKFQAPVSTDITIYVFVSDGVATQRKTQLALWDTDGTTELDCTDYSIFGAGDDVDINVYQGSLTPGETYYFSVDVGDSGSVGTFSLCMWDSD